MSFNLHNRDTASSSSWSTGSIIWTSWYKNPLAHLAMTSMKFYSIEYYVVAVTRGRINKLRQRRFFEICIYLFQTSRGQRQSFRQQSSSVDAHAESSSLVTIDDQFEVQVHLRLWVRAHAKNNDESAFPASDEVSSKNLKDEMETIQSMILSPGMSTYIEGTSDIVITNSNTFYLLAKTWSFKER